MEKHLKVHFIVNEKEIKNGISSWVDKDYIGYILHWGIESYQENNGDGSWTPMQYTVAFIYCPERATVLKVQPENITIVYTDLTD